MGLIRNINIVKKGGKKLWQKKQQKKGQLKKKEQMKT